MGRINPGYEREKMQVQKIMERLKHENWWLELYYTLINTLLYPVCCSLRYSYKNEIKCHERYYE
jgi:hypothetical protein